jgi:hypothetical protein
MPQYAEWNNTTYYVVNDVVDYQGSIYTCIANNVNQVPPSFPASWTLTGGGSVVLGIVAGTGVSVNAVPPTNPTISTNLATPVGDGRLTITPGIGTQLVLTNTCPASIAPGAGISITGTNPTGLTINNTGIQTLGVGAGLSTTGGVNPTIANTGVVNLIGVAPIVATNSGLGNWTISSTSTSQQQCKNFTPAPNVGGLTANTPFNIASIPTAGFSASTNVFSVAIRATGSINATFGGSGTIVFYLSDSAVGLPNSNQSPITQALGPSGGIFGSYDSGGFIVQFRVIGPLPANLYLNAIPSANLLGGGSLTTTSVVMNVIAFIANVVP